MSLTRGLVPVFVAGCLAAACTTSPAPSGESAPGEVPQADGDVPDPDSGSSPSGAGGDDGASRQPSAAPDGAGAGRQDEPVAPDLGAVDVELRVVAELDAPIAGTVADDGTVFVASREGSVHHLTTDGVSAPVLDLRAETTTDGERGLLGMAADGDTLYVSYTDAQGDTRLDAFPIGEDGGVDGADRRTVFALEQPYANHNGGDVHVGPDGYLYLSLGDGGGAGDPLRAAQDLSTPLGSLLRIAPDAQEPYGVPDDNPFVDDGQAAGEIYAYGLRNPWRFTFDDPTSTLWIADVGQSSREEINRVDLDEAAGANFGWSLVEGTEPYHGEAPEAHVPPIHEYASGGSEGCAVTGGVVYRGEAIPALIGVYVYADLCDGEVRGLAVDGEVSADHRRLGAHGRQIVSFAHDADGEILVFDLAGQILRLVPA